MRSFLPVPDQFSIIGCSFSGFLGFRIYSEFKEDSESNRLFVQLASLRIALLCIPKACRLSVVEFRILALLTLFVCSSATVFSGCLAPPDTRSWDQVSADFVAHEAQNASGGGSDGQRLKELDPKRAVAFLMPFLGKDRPFGLRVKAVNALGWSSSQEAIPALSAIALDPTEREQLRAEALNPGLRYMKSPEAVKTASLLATDKSSYVRSSAYWVLSDHGTDRAIEVLESRIKADDRPLLGQLMYALLYSKHQRAGKIVFDNVDFSQIQQDEKLLCAYSITMDRYRTFEAQENMLAVARQPTRPPSSYYALRYFAFFPCEDAATVLIAYVKADRSGLDLYESVTQFIKSPNLTEKSRAELSAFITSGKVRKAE